MLVFGGTSSTGLSWNVAKLMNAEIGKTEVKDFPDGEKYVNITSKVARQECAVIQSVRTNDDLIELFLMLDALRDQNAMQIHAVMPYLAYMRQDKRFNEGEALSAKTILKLIHELSDSVTTVNCHFLNEPGETVYNGIRFMNLDAIPELAKYMGKDRDKPIFIAPDKGSIGFAKTGAHILDCEFDHLKKRRVSGTEVEIEDKNLDIKGMDVIILDDIISTGGTIVEAAKIIRRSDPATVNVGCVHGLFLNGIESFKGSVSRLIASDSVDNPVSKVSVAQVIAKDLMR